jgi:S1-C subfamily serine protease
MKKVFLLSFLIFMGCCTVQHRRSVVNRGLQSLVYVEIHSIAGNGLASGCVLNKYKGYILTNKHVAPFGDEIIIHTKKGKSKASIVYNHPKLDIAVVKVLDRKILKDKRNIQFADTYNQGDMIYVLGHPFGAKNVVTGGIISKIIDNDILIDAALNFGNSGGLVINSHGKFVGLSYATDFRRLGIGYYKSGFSYAIQGKIVKKNIRKFLR